MKEEDKEGNVDFQSMVKEIASRWRNIPAEARERVERLAKQDLHRYKEEVAAYEEGMVKKSRREREDSIQTALKKQHEAESSTITDLMGGDSQRSASKRQTQNRQRKGQLSGLHQGNDPPEGPHFIISTFLYQTLRIVSSSWQEQSSPSCCLYLSWQSSSTAAQPFPQRRNPSWKSEPRKHCCSAETKSGKYSVTM